MYKITNFCRNSSPFSLKTFVKLTINLVAWWHCCATLPLWRKTVSHLCHHVSNCVMFFPLGSWHGICIIPGVIARAHPMGRAS